MAKRDPYAGKWTGPKRPYDLVKEFVVAVVVVAVLSTVLALIFSSPDERGVTIQRWAQQAPSDFVLTAVTELDGTSVSASYGPPYNNAGSGQQIFFLHMTKWVGVHVKVDPAVDFVLHPLSTDTGDQAVTAALATYQNASSDQQTKWATNYDQAIANQSDQDYTKVAAGDYGPVPTMVAGLLHLAQVGALDSQLVNTSSGFYQADYTKPLLFLSDGGYLADLAATRHLQGSQWGMMNETGNYPGQAWLWLYTFWYQISPFSSSGNADVLIWGMMMVLSLGLVLVPFIPGLRRLPEFLPIHRLVWRDYYRRYPAGAATAAAAASSAAPVDTVGVEGQVEEPAQS